MWQQRASYEQSNVLDVTIQCQFNIAAKNMAEFSNMFGSPNPHRQTPGQSTNDCQQAYYPNSCETPIQYRSPCAYENFQTSHDMRHIRTTNQTNTHLTSSPEMTSTNPPASFPHPHVSKLDYYNVNQFLDDSGYGSPSMNQRQLPVPASPSPVYSPAVENFTKLRVCSESPSDPWYYPQCNYGYNQRPNQPEVVPSPPIKDTDDHCEEMKLAMREKDVTHRLFALRARNKDAADEIEQYYQSQTALIDIERHNILCQMAYDGDSSLSINKYYNMKLLTLLDSVEQKLSASENEKSKTAKKCVTNQKKSRLLPKHSVKILESWYQENLENPYPSRDVTLTMAAEGGITVEQIRKWFANKRNRSRNSKLKKGLLDDCECE